MAEEDVAQTEKEFDAKLTESIGATLKEIQDRPVEDETPAPVVEATPAVSDKPRGEDGKFIKAEDKPAPVKESAAPAEKPDKAQIAGATEQAAAEPEQPLVTTTGQPIDINRPPSSWKPAAKVEYANLSPALKAEIHRRESDFLNGGKGLKENADLGLEIRKVAAPYQALLDAEGGSLPQAMAGYLRTAAVFRNGTSQQKLNAIFGLDQMFGVGLQQHFQTMVQSEVAKRTGQPVDPNAPQQPAQPQVFQDPRVDQLLANYQRQEQERAGLDKSAREKATENFLSAKDAKGAPLYPFVDNVADNMSVLVSAIRGQNPALGHEDVLKRAYEEAVWANPETRAVLLQQQQAQATQSQEKLQKVEQAKRASAGNMPKRGALPLTKPAAKFGSPEGDEQIRDTFRQLTA